MTVARPAAVRGTEIAHSESLQSDVRTSGDWILNQKLLIESKKSLNSTGPNPQAFSRPGGPGRKWFFPRAMAYNVLATRRFARSAKCARSAARTGAFLNTKIAPVSRETGNECEATNAWRECEWPSTVAKRRRGAGSVSYAQFLGALSLGIQKQNRMSAWA